MPPFAGSSAPAYAVAGASSNPSKFGNILLRWYADRSISITPVTPTSDEILGLKCVSDISNLGDPEVSLSIVTPPKVTKGILEQTLKLREGAIKGIWLQPGAEDGEVVQFIQSEPWLKERTVYGGPCVLVLGDRLRQAASATGKL